MVFIGQNISNTSITNNGNITGNIESRFLDKMVLTNNSGAINGNITFGTNADSSFTLNGGSINGTLSIGNSSQIINLNAGSFNGDIYLADGANLNLASTLLNGSIDSDSDHSATVNLTDNTTLNSNAILGSSNGLSAVNIYNNKTINANGTIRTQDLNIAQNSTLNIGSNNMYANNALLSGNLNFGNISRTFNGNITGNGNGSINLGGASHNIIGNLSLKSGDTLAIVVNGANSFGNVTATNAISIDSNTNLSVAINPTYSFINDGSKYTIVKGGNGSNINSIKDSRININGSNSNLFSLITFTTSSVNNNLILNANRKSASTITTNTSSQNAYNAINSIGSSATGELKSFQQYLDNSTSSSQVEEALTSVTPQNNNGIKLSNINAIIHSVKTAENRMDEIHLASIDSSAKVSSESNLIEASLDNPRKTSGISLGDEFETNGVWAQTFGTAAKQDNISNNDGYNSKSLGFAFGYDKEIIKNTRLGIATSYATSNIKSLDSLKNTDIDTYQLNVYSGHSFGKYFLDNIVGFAWNAYNSTRIISSISQSANANYNGQSYIAKIRGGMVKDLGNGFNITPEASINFVRNNVDGYTENGAGTTSLNVKSTSSNFLESRVGLNLGYKTIIKNTKVSPRISASYGYNFLNNRQTTTSNFVGQTATFNSLSSKIDQKSLKLGSGIDIYSTESTMISAEYIMEKKNKYRSHSGVLRVRFEF